MRTVLFGENAKKIESLVKELGFEIVKESPEVVVSYGGDGTLLSSERQYPSISKLPIRDSQFCHKCPSHEDKALLTKLSNRKLQLRGYRKLHTNLYSKDLYALNDFVVRNEEATHAIRFKVLTDGIPGPLFIGDGVVVATPFGSTGYFKSIAQQSFDLGFGLAFNNTTVRTHPIYFDENDTAGFKLVRGKGVLTFDNSPETFHLSEGTVLEFKLSQQVAKIYGYSSLRCTNCRVIRG